jgi:Ser/Thr protein kinase RdoA (MazF antagonist)
MIAYERLTNSGKIRRLHKLALEGLTHYDLKRPELTHFGFETNLMYKVMVESGEKYVLRLAYPGWRTYEDLYSEALWLKALEQDTDIPIPCVLPAQSGELVLSIDYPSVPDRWYMTLMRWLPGRLLGYYLTRANLAKMGGLFAELHAHGGRWNPPADFTQRRFEHWLSRGEKNLVTGSENNNRLSIPHQSLLARMEELVESAYSEVDRSDLRVIHCDLWHDNIKLHQGRLYPFDFEDTVWGFRAHDIAMAMLDLLETVGEVPYPDLLRAFRRGYETKMPWPENPIEPFQVGRLLWKINWVARFQPQYLEQMIARHVPVFDHFEKTRKVILPKPV